MSVTKWSTGTAWYKPRPVRELSVKSGSRIYLHIHNTKLKAVRQPYTSICLCGEAEDRKLRRRVGDKHENMSSVRTAGSLAPKPFSLISFIFFLLTHTSFSDFQPERLNEYKAITAFCRMVKMFKWMVEMPTAWLGLDLKIWLYGWGLLLRLLLLWLGPLSVLPTLSHSTQRT